MSLSRRRESHVAAQVEGDRRARHVAVLHVPGDDLAHTRHGLYLFPGSLSRRGLRGRSQDIRRQDAAALVRDVLEVHAQLSRGLGGQGAGLRPRLGRGFRFRRRGRRRCLELFDVLLRHAAAGAGAGDEGDVQTQLFRQLLRRRRRHDPAAGSLGRRRRGRRRRGRRGLGLRLGTGDQTGYVLAGRANHRHPGQAGQSIPLLGQDLQKRAGGSRLYRVRQFVRLHLEKGLALLHRLALFFEPAADCALRHREAELRHHYEFCHLHFLLIRPEHAQSRGLA